MNTQAMEISNDVRTLNSAELDAVSGGAARLEASFRLGNLVYEITAWSDAYAVVVIKV